MDNKLVVFPDPLIDESDKHASIQLAKEYSITSVINQLIECDAFIITTEVSMDNDANDTFKFNLDGYYVEIEWKYLAQTFTSLLNNKSIEENDYINFSVESTALGHKLIAESKFKGGLSGRYIKLALLETNDGKYFDIPQDSKLSINMLNIDDGQLEEFDDRLSVVEDKMKNVATKDDLNELSKRIDILESK